MPVEAFRAQIGSAHTQPPTSPSVEMGPPHRSLGWRASTIQAHREAIESVLLAMQARVDEPWSLRRMADLVHMSPYHFNRVFSAFVGVPPGRYLSALRLEAAKRLLLTSQLSVTDVCFEVGYRSLGTFSTQFTQLVGLTPKHLRQLARQDIEPEPDALEGPVRLMARAPTAGVTIAGRISAPGDWSGPICVGLFTTPIPQGRPVSCALLAGPGYYRLDAVPDGRYYLFAAGLRSLSVAAAYVAPDRGAACVAAGRGPVVIAAGRVYGPASLGLRPMQLTDPPILVALPLLVRERFALGRQSLGLADQGR